MTRIHVLLAALVLAAGGLAGCTGDEEEATNEDMGPADETGQPTDNEDTARGEDGTGGGGDGAAANGEVTSGLHVPGGQV